MVVQNVSIVAGFYSSNIASMLAKSMEQWDDQDLLRRMSKRSMTCGYKLF